MLYKQRFESEVLNMAEFKDILQYLREKSGMSQRELAAKLNLSSAAVSNYEKGVRVPDLQTLNLLADIFGVSLGFLTGKENNAEINRINWDMAVNPNKYQSETETEIAIAKYDRDDFIIEMVKTTANFSREQMQRVLEYAKGLQLLSEKEKR